MYAFLNGTMGVLNSVDNWHIFNILEDSKAWEKKEKNISAFWNVAF